MKRILLALTMIALVSWAPAKKKVVLDCGCKKEFNIKEFSSDPTGMNFTRYELLRAINVIDKCGGGTLTFPKGSKQIEIFIWK